MVQNQILLKSYFWRQRKYEAAKLKLKRVLKLVLIIFVMRTELAAPKLSPTAGLSRPSALAPVASRACEGFCKGPQSTW